jgi:hypothetical protein
MKRDNPMRKLTLMLLALAAAPVAATAAEYTIMIYERPAQIALRESRTPEGAAYWAAFAAYGEQMTAAGIMRGGAALVTTPAQGLGAPSGHFLIEAPDLAAAEAWAARAPSVARGGTARASAHIAMAR